MSDMKKSGESSAGAITLLENFLENFKKRSKINIEKIFRENCYLTADEESTVINVAKLMASMGLRITNPYILMLLYQCYRLE